MCKIQIYKRKLESINKLEKWIDLSIRTKERLLRNEQADLYFTDSQLAAKHSSLAASYVRAEFSLKQHTDVYLAVLQPHKE